MPDTLYIQKNPDLPASQDYRFLKAEGLRHIESLARELWTDYNVHDPGITILELLCYAITDLGYRTNYPIQDLLTRTVGDEPRGVGTFHQAREVLSSDPVTFADLRKLLIDIEGVRNAWIEPHETVVYCRHPETQELRYCEELPPDVRLTNPPMNGLYDVTIDLETDQVEEDKHRAVLGLVDDDVGRGRYIRPSTRGIQFDVIAEVTLDAVHIYPEAAGRVQIRLLDADRQVLNRRVVVVDTPRERTRIPLGFQLRPGIGYRLDAYGSEIELHRTTGVQYDFAVEGLMRLATGIHGTRRVNPYYFFYAWEISYAAPPGPPDLRHFRVGRTDRVGLPGAYIHPEEKGIAFEVMADLSIETVSVYADRPGTIRLRIVDEEGAEITEVEAHVPVADEKHEISVGAELQAGREYRMLGGESDVELYRNTRVTYPLSAEGVIQLVEGIPGEHRYYFFYDWSVSYRPPVVETSGLARADIYEQVTRTLSRHRNLCEDFIHICALEKEEVAVCADIELEPGKDVEEALADILHAVGTFVAPPVRFYTLQEMLDKGRSPELIFEGPMLRHGFIDHEEFQRIERRTELYTSDIVQLIMDVPGVTAVRNISLLSFLGDELRRQDDWVLELEDERVAAFAEERSKIIFYKNDLPYYANRSAVRELLEDRQFRNRSGSRRSAADNFPVPLGEDKQLERYYPAQNELPKTYMVGEQRVPKSESDSRKAQARQLKAYLMFFEQLLANYLAQLSNAYRLFSWAPGSVRTYFTQVVDEIARVEEIYDPSLVDEDGLQTDLLSERLHSLVEDENSAQDRRSRFLDHLIGRFAEQFAEYATLMLNHDRDAAPRLIEDRRLFLENYPRVSGNRGTAFDYLGPEDSANLSGYQKRVYRLLGVRELRRRNLAGHLFSIESVVEDEQIYWRFVLRDEQGDRLFVSTSCRSKFLAEALLDGALGIGGSRDNYRRRGDDGGYDLVFECPDPAGGEDTEHVVGTTTSLDVLEDVRESFAEFSNREGFHVVEHVLLRPRTKGDPFLPVQTTDEEACDCVEVTEPYSFRMSVLLPSWPERFQDLKFRAYVERTLRLEAPAHVYVKICWISHEQMKVFEELHSAWLTRLAGMKRYLGGCPSGTSGEDLHFDGSHPLPDLTAADETIAEQCREYREALTRLIERLHRLDNVFPMARLHDCTAEADSETPQVTLNNTNLGTF